MTNKKEWDKDVEKSILRERAEAMNSETGGKE